MTHSEYQDMSTGYSPLRLATPSGTGEAVQPCVNCGQPVRRSRPESYGVFVNWLHWPGLHRMCKEDAS